MTLYPVLPYNFDNDFISMRHQIYGFGKKKHFVASSLFSLGDSNQIHSIAGSLGSDWRREIDSEAKKKMKARS